MVCLLKDVKVQLKVRRTLRSVGTSSSNIFVFIVSNICNERNVIFINVTINVLLFLDVY